MCCPVGTGRELVLDGPTGGAVTRWLQPLLPAPNYRRSTAATSWPAGLALAGWLVAGLLAALATTLAVVAGATESGSVSLLMGQLGLWTGFVTTAVVASRRFGAGALRADFGFTITFVDMAKSAVIGIAVQVLVVPVIYFPLIAAGVDLDVSGAAEELFRDLAGLEKVAIAVGVIAVAPVAEELLFRGVLLRGLAQHLGDRGALWATALVFAGSHFQVVQFPGLVAIGLTLAWLAQRTGGVAAPIWAHLAFNATTVAFLW